MSINSTLTGRINKLRSDIEERIEAQNKTIRALSARLDAVEMLKRPLPPDVFDQMDKVMDDGAEAQRT